MRLNFQKTIASSQMTLPIVCLISIALWFVLPMPKGESALMPAPSEHGLWQLVPSFLQSGYYGMGLSLLASALTVYLMAELNNSNVLLRISSRMLSSTLAFLLAIATTCHSIHSGSIVALFVMLVFFALFKTYQLASPMLTFSIYLQISIASLVFPKMLFFIPIYWILHIYLRAFSFRCLIASILGTILPYWFYLCIAFSLNQMPMFFEHCTSLISLQWFDYSHLTIKNVLPFAFFMLLFFVGMIDFYRNSFLDKTRTRIIYNVVIIHGLFVALFICLQPQLINMLMPTLLIDTAIVFGHFFALTYTRVSHIICIVLGIMSLAMIGYMYTTAF